ncbi:6-phosphogluconolactonase [Shinella sp. G-2]|uniref:6-phosphogluconolactonase n=1 Tax=Shinella sp. G-2 TaxID=3133141 RepID=UPI003D0140E6
MKTTIHDTPEAIGDHLAGRILTETRAANAAGRAYVLGCPGGRSPMPVYEALERQLAAAPVDCSRLVIAMMDEYLLSDGDGLIPPPASAHYSCRGFGEREIVGRINRALPENLRMPVENFRMPTIVEPEAYDAELAALGGIDLFLLASGAGDGHIAFNPPGSARDSRSRIVALAEQTRRDNLATFPDFAGIEEVPAHGITIGIGSIAALSKAVAMIVWGDGKREAFRRLSSADSYDPRWPATILAECRNGELHADAAAGARP